MLGLKKNYQHCLLFPYDCKTYIPTTHFRFTNTVCKYWGATHDAYILAISSISEIMDQLPGGGWLLGGSGYPLRPWLMTPFLTPQAKQQDRYNASHIKTRNCVERDFDVLKFGK